MQHVAVIQCKICGTGTGRVRDHIFDDIAVTKNFIHNVRIIEHARGSRLIDAEAVIQEIYDAAARNGHKTAYGGDGREHAVDALAADILLIVADIRIDRRRQNLHKGVHQVVHPIADDQQNKRHPGCNRSGIGACHIYDPHNGKHQGNEHNIHYIGGDEHETFAPQADKHGREQHTREPRSLAEQRNHGIRCAAANAAVAVKPAEHICHRSLKETEPCCHGNDPEIFVAQHLAQRIHETDLDDMRFCLNNLFLGIHVNDDAQDDRNNRNGRVDIAIQPNIIQVIVG